MSGNAAAPCGLRTHTALDPRWTGTPVELTEGSARVTLATFPNMAADAHGLVHGGFVFGLADHAAMLAVNHPNVVLAKAEARFLAPVRVGEELSARGQVVASEGKKSTVEVTVTSGEREVFRGTFFCVSPHHHVLEAP